MGDPAPRRAWLALLLWALGTGLAQACPTCVAGMDQDVAARVTAGYLTSYAFIALCPIVIVSSIGWHLFSALQEDVEIPKGEPALR